MADDPDWQCGDCGTLIDGPETRQCPNCGGSNFYPLADEVPGGEQACLVVSGDVERAIDRLDGEDG